jgi:hypothetical protein
MIHQRLLRVAEEDPFYSLGDAQAAACLGKDLLSKMDKEPSSDKTQHAAGLSRRERSKLAYETGKANPYLLYNRNRCVSFDELAILGSDSGASDKSKNLEKARFVLKEAFNQKVTKCPIHETCDGVTVTNPHLTEQMRQTAGFKDLYPVITVGERTMIDWDMIWKEEKKSITQEKTEAEANKKKMVYRTDDWHSWTECR